MNKAAAQAVLGLAAALTIGCCVVVSARGQTPTAPATTGTSRLTGTVVSVDGMKLAIKDQSGTQQTVMVTDATTMVRIAPGQTTLAGAEPIHITDIQPGDRLLVRVQPGDTGMVALRVVAMKESEIAQQHAQMQAAWQHGIGGLVKAVNAADGTITLDASGARGATTIKLGPAALVKHYAPGSVEYEQAQPSSLDKIVPGDQVRARGTAGAEHTFMADEVVAGSFRNLSGKVTAVDAQAGTVSFTDLATNKPVSIKVTGDTQLRKLDDATADKLAASMKSAEAAGAPPASGAQAAAHPNAGASGNAGPAAHGVSEQGSMRKGSEGGSGAASQGDTQQAFAHAAAIHLSDLKKGDFVMVVASSGADNQLGAVTMVSNVEPLLRASPNGSAAALSSWSMGGGVPSQQ